jgi:hypothetical protein
VTAGARGETAGLCQRKAGQLRHPTTTVPEAALDASREGAHRRSASDRYNRQPERSHDRNSERRARAATPGEASPHKHAAIVAALNDARLPVASAVGMSETQHT